MIVTDNGPAFKSADFIHFIARHPELRRDRRRARAGRGPSRPTASSSTGSGRTEAIGFIAPIVRYLAGAHLDDRTTPGTILEQTFYRARWPYAERRHLDHSYQLFERCARIDPGVVVRLLSTKELLSELIAYTRPPADIAQR